MSFADRADLQEGDRFLPPEFRRHTTGFYVEAACQEARGLSEGEDCYELRLFRLFGDEYIDRRPEGKHLIAGYREEATRILRAIERLPSGMAREIYLSIYEHGVIPIVDLILNGRWDEAYEAHAEMHRDLKAQFLGNGSKAG